MDAFDAATHCASLTAAERLARQQQQETRQQQPHPQPQPQPPSTRSQQQGVTAEVSLQVAAQHGAPGSCPHSTAQHGMREDLVNTFLV